MFNCIVMSGADGYLRLAQVVMCGNSGSGA